MFHLLPFAAGLVVGAATLKLIKNDKARKQLDKAQDRLREATVSSLSAIEQSSALLRTRLAAESKEVVPTNVVVKVATPSRKPAGKSVTPRKAATKSAKGGAKEGLIE